MANKIQIRRGTKAKLPTLSAGEPAFLTDTRELFVGTGSGNVNMGGSMWYKGTAMSGTVTTTGYYYYSACPQVKVGDTYLNTSNGNIYECTTAGSGQAAKWTYKGCIKGVQGAQGEPGEDATPAATYIVTTTAELNAAVTALNAASGGKIILREGTYTLSSTIISKPIVFEGMGRGITNVTHAGIFASGRVEITFRNLSIELTTSSSRYDSALLTFENCGVGDDGTHGDIFVGNNQDIYFKNCGCDFTATSGSLHTSITCSSVIIKANAYFYGCKISALAPVDNRKTIVYLGDIHASDTYITFDTLGGFGDLATKNVYLYNTTVDLTDGASISHDYPMSNPKGVITGCTIISGGLIYIGAGVVTNNVFVPYQTNTIALSQATIFSNNKFIIGSYTTTILGSDEVQRITGNLSDETLIIKNCTTGSVITDNTTY